MSYQLVDQVNLWWKTISDKESLNTYQKTVQTTWNILRETAKLVWLFLCLGLILVTWIWTSSKESGQQLKTWYEGVKEPKSEHIWAEASQFLMSTSRTTAEQVVAQAREQLGLPVSEARPMAKSVAAAPTAKTATAPAEQNPEVKTEGASESA